MDDKGRRNSHDIINLEFQSQNQEFSQQHSQKLFRMRKRQKSKQSKNSSKKKVKKSTVPLVKKSQVSISFETEQKNSQSIRTELANNKVKLHGKLNLPSSQSPARNNTKQPDQTTSSVRLMKIAKRGQLKSAHPSTMTVMHNKQPLASANTQVKVQSSKKNIANDHTKQAFIKMRSLDAKKRAQGVATSEKQFSQTINHTTAKQAGVMPLQGEPTNNIDFHASRLFSGVTINSTFTNGNKGNYPNNGIYCSASALPLNTYKMPNIHPGRQSQMRLRNSQSSMLPPMQMPPSSKKKKSPPRHKVYPMTPMKPQGGMFYSSSQPSLYFDGRGRSASRGSININDKFSPYKPKDKLKQ